MKKKIICILAVMSVLFAGIAFAAPKWVPAGKDSEGNTWYVNSKVETIYLTTRQYQEYCVKMVPGGRGAKKYATRYGQQVASVIEVWNDCMGYQVTSSKVYNTKGQYIGAGFEERTEDFMWDIIDHAAF